MADDPIKTEIKPEDVEGLESEAMAYKQKEDPQTSLYDCGATKEEADFLVSANTRYGH